LLIQYFTPPVPDILHLSQLSSLFWHLDQFDTSSKIVPLVKLRRLGLGGQLFGLGWDIERLGGLTGSDVRAFDTWLRGLVEIDRVGIDLAIDKVRPETV
jgi:hypothetical protein